MKSEESIGMWGCLFRRAPRSLRFRGAEPRLLKSFDPCELTRDGQFWRRLVAGVRQSKREHQDRNPS